MAAPRPRDAQSEPLDWDWYARYEIENPAEVEAYVRAHPTLVPVLERASTEISARFGTDTSVVLACVLDQEDDPASHYLSLGIVPNLDETQAYARRQELDDAWWLDAIRDVAGLLTIDIAHR